MTTTAIGAQSGTVTANIANNAHLAIRPIVRIHLLGSMRATSYLGDDVLPRAKKARAALAYLCLAHQGRAPRSRIASMLWDRASAPQARTNFRQALFDLNEAMGSLAAELILTGRASVRLNTDICWIDALALVKSPYSDDSTRADLAVLCPGELLEGLDEVSTSFGAWLAKERVLFKERIAASLHAALQQTIGGDGDAKHVAAIARRLISLEPTHRDASRALMHALVKLGEQAGAMREYERCREALWQALRVKPEMASERLYESIRAQAPRTGSSAADASTDFHRTPTDVPSPLPGRHRLRVGVNSFIAEHKEECLALSLSHEIAAGLARYRWFDVITPASLRRSLSTGGDQHEYANLDYVLDGSISENGKRLKINVRLLDLVGQEAQPVWTEQFEIALTQLHRLDELVSTRIVARIDPVILHIEGQPKRRDRFGATGLLLRAIPMIFSMERERYEAAGRLIQQALELEPDNARAEAWAAHWHNFYIGQGWAKDIVKATEKMQQHALRAITLDPENAEALGIYAFSIARMAKDFDRALLFFDRALRLNPSSAFVWALSAATYCYIGQPDEALQRLRRYRELGSPHLYYFECLYTIAYTFKGDYERAVLVGRRAVEGNPNHVAGYKPLVASLGHLGRRGEAQEYLSKLLALEPNFTVERFGQDYSFKKMSDRERYIAGLRLAGVPER
jgi:DNA-binding SARP family transcriptional activator/Flp pilus assembly protein TadD